MTKTEETPRGSTSLAPAQTRELLNIEEARALLAKSRDLGEIRGIRDKAEAIRAYRRSQEDGLAAQNDAAMIKLLAERRLGELLAERAPIPGPGRGRKESHDATAFQTNADYGIDKDQSSRWQKVASVPQDVFDLHVKETLERAAAGDSKAELTTASVLKIAGGSRPANWTSESNEWYTPARYIDAARVAVGGEFDLDPASSEKANATVGARRIFTRDDDGLGKRWKGRVWLNPPYGETEGGDSSAGVWGAKLIAEHAAGRVTAGILLVNAVTDRKWFQPFWAFPICFTDHRIEFYTPAGQPRSPVNGNAFVLVGGDVDAFAAAFAEIGPVVARVSS